MNEKNHFANNSIDEKKTRKYKMREDVISRNIFFSAHIVSKDIDSTILYTWLSEVYEKNVNHLVKSYHFIFQKKNLIILERKKNQCTMHIHVYENDWLKGIRII